MATIRERSGKLIADFRYMGIRCREKESQQGEESVTIASQYPSEETLQMRHSAKQLLQFHESPSQYLLRLRNDTCTIPMHGALSYSNGRQAISSPHTKPHFTRRLTSP